MQNAIKRNFVHLKGSLSTVNLSLCEEAPATKAHTAPSARAMCEVIEFDGDEGWNLWTESGFLPLFENSVFSLPGHLGSSTGRTRSHAHEESDPFRLVTKNSA
jgi:hypothetical protein